MYCKKCGKEIKEGNTFCTNCGEPINNIKENTTRTETNTNTDEKENNKSNKKVIKLKLWHIITITLICLALLIGVVVIFNNKNNSDKLQNVNNIVAQDTSKSNDKKYDVEIGKYYKYSLDNQYSTIVFNDTTGFIIKSGVVNSEENIETGTYQIEDNKITFTINYNSIYGDGEGISDEDVKIPYTKEMTILENGNIEYVTPYTTCLYVKEGSNTGTEEITSANLLETIYAKYPEMKEKDGFICTDGEQYWLLDKAGKKIYFHDLDSFDSALVKSYTSEGSNENVDDIKNNGSNTGNKNSSSSSSSTNGKEYINIPNLLGLTEQQAISKAKELNVPYQISYQEDLSENEGVVLDQSHHNEVYTDSHGKIVAAYSRSILYPGETLYIFVNKYKERTIVMSLHRTCLIEKYILNQRGVYSGYVDKIDSPLDLVVKINGKVVLSDKLTNNDLNVDLYNCTTSEIKFTGKYSPKVEIFVNNELFRTYTEDDMSSRFYDDVANEQGQQWQLLFKEHGAG